MNASGSGAASYPSITISPSGGAARTISGAITAGSPLIDFKGADNVTINGLNTGGNSLTISNTTVSGNPVTTLAYTGTTAFAPVGIRDSSGVAASANNFVRNIVTNITTTETTAVFGIDNSTIRFTITR